MPQSSQSPSQKKLANSAEAIKRSTAQVEDSADRRTVLAADRTVFAAERTYAAWVRTGLFGLASGLGAKAGLAGVVPEWMILANGTLLVLFSVFCFIVAVWHPLHPGPPPPRPDVRGIPPELLIAVNAVLTLVSSLPSPAFGSVAAAETEARTRTSPVRRSAYPLSGVDLSRPRRGGRAVLDPERSRGMLARYIGRV